MWAKFWLRLELTSAIPKNSPKTIMFEIKIIQGIKELIMIKGNERWVFTGNDQEEELLKTLGKLLKNQL